MSRFMKQAITSENAYIEFRFEHSLRKYQQKPIKKIKCNQICSHCQDHHRKKNHSFTPQRVSMGPNRGQRPHLGSIERQSLRQKQSEGHLVSSNKTIKLSKRKPLDVKSENNRNNLQLKMYASLAHISKGDSKVQKSLEGKSELEDEVFLNDFQISEGMEEEKESQADGDFRSIQLTDKEKQNHKIEEQHQIEVQHSSSRPEAIPDQDQLKLSQEEKKVDELQALPNYSILELSDDQGRRNRQNSHYSIGRQREEIQMKESISIERQDQQSLSASIEKLSVEQAEDLDRQPRLQNNTAQNLEGKQQVAQRSQYEQEGGYQHSLGQTQRRGPIRAHPDQQSSILSSKLIEQHHLSESMMDKCLAFQGGRIYIDSAGQNFYISVRVFNKLRRQCSTVDDLIRVLIHQRPYLQTKKEQIQAELQQYLQDDA